MTTFEQTQPNQQIIPEIIHNQNTLQDELPFPKKTSTIGKTQDQTKQKTSKNSMVLQVITATINAGVLSLPETVSRLGLFPYLISCLLSSLLAYAGFYFIISVLAQKRSETYAEMVGDSLGLNAKKLSKIILTLKAWTQTIVVQIMFIKFALQILHDSFGLPLFEDRNLQIYSSQGHAFCAVMGVFMIIANIRFLMMTSLEDVLHTIGRFSLFGVLFCLLVVICTCFSGFSRPHPQQDLVYKSVFKMEGELIQNWKTLSWDYFKTFCQQTSLIFFVLYFHNMYFVLFKDFERPTQERVQYVIRWSIISFTFIFMTFGVLSYLLLVQHLDLLPIASFVISSIPTMPMTIAKVVLTLSFLIKLSIPVFTTKDAIYEITGIERNHQNLIKLNVGICLSTVVFAITFQKITSYFSIFGGTFGISIAVIFPLLCARKLLKFNKFQKGLVVFTIITSIICLFGSITQAASQL